MSETTSGVWPVADSWMGEEVYIPRIDRWFEVRVQVIRWVDGQPAQLVVATDITALRPIRERQKQQEEQLQQTARLVTMGEMASSIAHELNQPLAAISNYALGLAKRLQPGSPAPADPAMVDQTLDKIARQAQRAASVIQRVRNFVRRNTAEQREIAVDEILTEALALAEIAAKRYGVAITIDLAPDLPRLSADRILIEQVLLNLMKNAIDAMRGQDDAALTLQVSATRQARRHGHGAQHLPQHHRVPRRPAVGGKQSAPGMHLQVHAAGTRGVDSWRHRIRMSTHPSPCMPYLAPLPSTGPSVRSHPPGAGYAFSRSGSPED